MTEVEERFRKNFAAGRDSGSGMCVFGGEMKWISLYGGFLAAERLLGWREDMLVEIWYWTKGVVVACLLPTIQEAGLYLS